MKKIFYITALLSSALFVLASCQKKESEYVISGDPYFKAEVIAYESSTTGEKLAELEEDVQFQLEQSSDAYSASANAASHVRMATRFKVASNLRWKVVPAGETYDWIHPFPESGEKEGIFFFKSDRNISSESTREAYFNVLVDKGAGYVPLEGMITVTQAASAPFLEMSAAKFNLNATSSTLKLAILSNVDWSYTLEPMADYGTADVEWITDKTGHEVSDQIDTLNLKVAANNSGIRGANIVLKYTLGETAKQDVIPITQYPANEVELEGFPVRWVVQNAANTYSATWPASGYIAPVSGAGYIQFNNECGKAADVNGKVLLDFDKTTPRATGVWPGDYCEFVASSPVSAGTIAKLAFTTRVSGTGHKYWRLEYRDGDNWKIAGTALTDEGVNGPDGNPVVYTHAMEADGATNIDVNAVVKYEQNTDQVEFRFICAANWQANGKGALAAPNGGTWRICVGPKNADFDPSDEHNPVISIVAAGPENLTRANLNVSASYLSFEGQNPATKTVKVESDQDFTITPDKDWIHVDKTSGEAGTEDFSFTVTVDPSTLSENREGTVLVKAGITRKEIAIIQGAAGQQLDPFIAVVSSSKASVKSSAGSVVVSVMANTEVSVEAHDWITVKDANTKAMVETKEYLVEYSENEAVLERVGKVRFYNAEKNLEAVFTLTQEKSSRVEFPVTWSFKEPGDDWKEGVDWKCQNPTGSYVYSDTHDGKMSVVRFGGTPMSSGSEVKPTYKNDTPLGTRLLHYGMYKNDYWLFEVENVKNPAGTYTIGYGCCSSAAGPKYFALEYSLDGGETWTGINTKTESISLKSGSGARDVTYTFAISPTSNKANEVCVVTESFHLEAMTKMTKLMIRARVADTMKLDKSAEMTSPTHAGTNRIGNKAEIQFVAD